MTNMPLDDWRNPAFRQNTIREIEEHMQLYPVPMTKSVSEMENHIFGKSKSKDEYVNMLNKLLGYFKNYKNKGMVQGPNNVNAVQKGMQDPIGALQSLARQSTSNNNLGMQGPGQNQPMSQQIIGQQIIGQQIINQQMGPTANIASNLLQSLNQMKPGQPMNIQQAMHNKMSGMTLLQNQQMNINQMGQMQNMQNSMMNQMNSMNQSNMAQQIVPQHSSPQQQMGSLQIGPNQMQQNMQNQMQNQVGHQMGNSINPGMQSMIQQQHMNQINAAQMNVNQISQQQLSHLQRKPVEVMNANYAGQRNLTPNQFLGQSPSPSAPSPSGLGAPGSNQMVPSPALVPSPNPQHTILGNQRSMAMAPSPSSSLNTPAGIVGGAIHSPLQDEQISQACKEKIQKLRKYIDPLNKMIIKMTNDGFTEKTSKMKKLLELLTNPSSVTKLDVLQKCEIVLEKMDFKKFEGSVPTGPTIPSNLKEHHFLTPVLDAVSNLLQSPSPNHTLYRTFGPCVESLFGPEIKNIPRPLKRQKTEESSSEIPDVLQGEIARLDQRFKISLDPAQQCGSKCIQLICWLDDKHLPCVPPIMVTVPNDYPTVPPKCILTSHEYSTPYLNKVQSALDARLSKLPKKYSISQILDNWEMSVRQACAPKFKDSENFIINSSIGSTKIQPTTVTASTNSVASTISTSLINSAAS